MTLEEKWKAWKSISTLEKYSISSFQPPVEDSVINEIKRCADYLYEICEVDGRKVND